MSRTNNRTSNRKNSRTDPATMMASSATPSARLGRCLLAAAALGAAALLAACGRPAETTDASSQRPPDAVVSDTGRNAGQVAAEVRQDVREAGQAVADKAKDLAITTEVNTLLARDEQLSALSIDVDTNAGQVVLQGNAPTETSRARAADLARSVGGVLGVDNKLTVQARN